MTTGRAERRPGKLSVLMIVTSIGASIAISVAMDVVLLRYKVGATPDVFVGVLFNGTCILQSVVGAIIEWRRPGHTIGRLLMLSGPLYALLAVVWLTADTLESFVDPQLYRVVTWGGTLLSYPGMALIAGWVPLLFPTGTLPGPRWRIPVGLLVVLSSIGLVASAVPVWTISGRVRGSPIVFDAWPPYLQPFVDAIPLELMALIALAIAGLITRYRRGDRIERLQIRWFGAAVAVLGVGFGGVLVEMAVRTGDGPLVSALIPYAGILAMPIAIGIAVTRYRLYEIDRLISRTIGWAVVTGILGAVFAATIVGLQTILADVTQAQTLSVAASTLVAFVLFQPLRRRVQSVVDHRFNRARYDAERTAAAFAERQRDQVDIAGLKVDIAGTIDSALSPRTVGIWIRPSGRGGMP
ncbi:MAG TPA: hypothetical protein VHM48_12590 [Candidatus Limnocylindrales bacterium]|nr:hypothetical protein [Candidatus Limnocylindrales bacterium]